MTFPLTKGHLSYKDNYLAEEVSLLQGDHCTCLCIQLYMEGVSVSNYVVMYPEFEELGC